MAIYMAICPKCAWFKGRRICDFCNEKMIPTEVTLDEAMDLSEKEEDELINHYIETLINDTYDPKAREYREENEETAFEGYIHESKSTCPTCGSTNVEKISAIKKVIGGAMFGLFSSDVRNMMHCNSCGYKW